MDKVDRMLREDRKEDLPTTDSPDPPVRIYSSILIRVPKTLPQDIIRQYAVSPYRFDDTKATETTFSVPVRMHQYRSTGGRSILHIDVPKAHLCLMGNASGLHDSLLNSIVIDRSLP
jgi:hypothetical protein